MWRTSKVLLGYLSFAAFVVPLGRLHFRWIQQGSFRLPCHDPDVVRPIPPLALRDIRWWSTALYLASPLFPRENQAFITTDASDSGWGFEVNSVCSRGVWDPHQLAWHINRKEMFAVSMAIKSNLPFLSNKTVLVQSDNSTVVAYLKYQGGTKSKRLLRDTILLFQLAAAHNIHLNAQFIPSRYNTVADCLSRNRRLPDWHLSPQVTSHIFSAWGTPVIDLMATHASAVVPRYVSLLATDRNAEFTDAFSRPWHFPLAWIFPPPALVPRVLQHLNSATGTYILITPRWERVFWRPDLKARATARPLRIDCVAPRLIDLATNRPPENSASLRLEAWRVRGGFSRLLRGATLTVSSSLAPGDDQR